VGDSVKLLCVFQGHDMASSRIRVLRMLPHLRDRGFECEAAPYPKNFLGVIRTVARSAAFDLVWLQKKLPNPVDRSLWRRAVPPIVFDFDDAICFRKEPKKGSYVSPTRARRFAGVVDLAAGVTCGNRYLASLLPTATKKVFVYPSPVPAGVPTRDYYAGCGPLRLGWIGGGGNLASLGRIGPALSAVARSHSAVLRVISDREFEWPGLAVENIPWSLDGEAASLAELDAGLMPLDGDSPFDRGKCSYKILQYMAAGVVPVGSAVGMNVEVVEEGRNGFLVRTESEWERVLRDLASCGREGLAPMGAAARSAAEAHFSYEALANGLAAFLRGLIPGRRNARAPHAGWRRTDGSC
jgi:hypothetical protein